MLTLFKILLVVVALLAIAFIFFSDRLRARREIKMLGDIFDTKEEEEDKE